MTTAIMEKMSGAVEANTVEALRRIYVHLRAVAAIIDDVGAEQLRDATSGPSFAALDEQLFNDANGAREAAAGIAYHLTMQGEKVPEDFPEVAFDAAGRLVERLPGGDAEGKVVVTADRITADRAHVRVIIEKGATVFYDHPDGFGGNATLTGIEGSEAIVEESSGKQIRVPVACVGAMVE